MSAAPGTGKFLTLQGVRKDAQSVPVRATVTLVALSDRNGRMGETHPNAKFSDELVEAIRDAYEAGAPPPGQARLKGNCVGYKALALRFGVSVRAIRDICNYRRRNGWADRWKRV